METELLGDVIRTKVKDKGGGNGDGTSGVEFESSHRIDVGEGKRGRGIKTDCSLGLNRFQI